MTEVSAFGFFDYREFLKEYFENKKKWNPQFSHRLFARQAGLGSPSYLLMVIKGERNLSLRSLKQFVDGLKLANHERQYFETLVLYGQTKDLQEKSVLFSELLRLRSGRSGLHDLERDRFEFLSKWYVVATYVLAGVDGFTAEPSWVVHRLRKKITVSQAREALEILKRLELIHERDGTWVQSNGAISVKDDTRAMAVAQYHDSMIKLAYEALKQLPSDQRELNGATVSIPAHALPELKEKIRAFRKEINAWASSFEDSNQVFQMNVQLFPLSEAIAVEKPEELTQ